MLRRDARPTVCYTYPGPSSPLVVLASAFHLHTITHSRTIFERIFDEIGEQRGQSRFVSTDPQLRKISRYQVDIALLGKWQQSHNCLECDVAQINTFFFEQRLFPIHACQ